MKKFYLIILSTLFTLLTQAQDVDFSKIKPGGVKLYLTEDSSSYFRLFSFTHIWLRYTDFNPGTVDAAGEPKQHDFDVGIRRNRSGFYLHLFERLITFTQFGISVQTYVSDPKPQLFFLDLTTEYEFIKEKLSLGYGLHSWQGVARQGNIGAPHFLYIDNPGFSYPLVGTFDQSGRQLGVYARGLLGDFQYRVSLSKPFSYNALLNTDTLYNVAYEYPNTTWSYKGYFNWQFLENEPDEFAWKRMNYLGQKKIFNIGAGFHYHPATMQTFEEPGADVMKEDMLLTGVDAFLDYPLANESSFTGYLVWFNYDFGSNYLRRGGLMNTGFGGEINDRPLLQGGGNSEWAFGTGNIVHAEAGYLLPAFKFLNGKKLQFFGGYTFKDLEGLGTNLHQFDAGLNYLFYHHHVKCGLQISSRPIYDGTIGENAQGSVVMHKATVIFNTQVDF